MQQSQENILGKKRSCDKDLWVNDWKRFALCHYYSVQKSSISCIIIPMHFSGDLFQCFNSLPEIAYLIVINW